MLWSGPNKMRAQRLPGPALLRASKNVFYRLVCSQSNRSLQFCRLSLISTVSPHFLMNCEVLLERPLTEDTGSVTISHPHG
jgi:hypothetical protein